MRSIFLYILVIYLKFTLISSSNRKSNGSSINETVSQRSFVIDYNNDTFLKDGVPFQYISGSIHYFRVPRPYWRDRLRKYRAAGLNAIDVYVEWSLHEPNPGHFEFSGEKDLEYFIELAIEEDLLVIFRPGPYICAERDFGGLPSWLLSLYPDIELRRNDKNYNRHTKLWFEELFRRIGRFLYGNGGPIIMVQVENEYGKYPLLDITYMAYLRDVMRNLVDGKALLFAIDGFENGSLLNGTASDVYETIDFGIESNVNKSFGEMRLYSPKGPLVNSEFYPGWLSHWNESMIKVDTQLVLNTLKEMLELKANVNFYMFHGGTNFGFTNGANYEGKYFPQLTSYDYDAPLNEAGDTTPKYFAIRELIGQYFKLPNISISESSLKGKYGKVILRPLASIFGRKSRTYKIPQTFESINQSYGYVLYETMIPNNYSNSEKSILKIEEIHDRAIIFVNEIQVGVFSRSEKINSLTLTSPLAGRKLSLLVENQGRINYKEYLKDFKGILSDVTLDEVPLHEWNITGLPVSTDEINTWVTSANNILKNAKPPLFYRGELILSTDQKFFDTFVDLRGWGKGVIYVNDFNLGRYWPSVGSQVTLYVPGCYLKQKNIITVFETDYAPSNLSIYFIDKPVLDIIEP